MKHQFRHLSYQFLDYLSSQLAVKSVSVYSLFSSIDNADRICVYCNSGDNLLVKCQYKNCMRFCHFPCYLNHTGQMCYHEHLYNASVALLFYCDDHKPEINEMANEDESSHSLAKTRLMSKREELKHQSVDIINSILNNHSFDESILNEPLLFPILRDYPSLLKMDPVRCESLRWISKKLIMEGNSKKPIIIGKEKEKGTRCAVCCDLINKEIFPRMGSKSVCCQECKTTVHCFCEGIAKENRKKWICCQCNLKNQGKEAVCIYCQKSDGFLSFFQVNNSSIVAHYPCYLQTVLPSIHSSSVQDQATVSCSVCRDVHAVFTCYSPDCMNSCHYVCGSHSGAFFFYPYYPSTYLVYSCSEHLSKLPSFLASFSPKPSSLSLSTSQETFLHPLRSVLSFSSIIVFNNQPSYLTTKSMFTHFGLTDVLPRERKERSEPIEKKKRGKKPKAEEKTLPISCSDESEEQECGYSCSELWRYVEGFFGKRISKKDVLTLLRLNPKHVVFLSFLKYRLFL